MPRRDGFPTNQEMLTDFTAMSRDVFVTAYDREFESELPAAFCDKPLKYLNLEITEPHTLHDGLNTPEAVRAERLRICTFPESPYLEDTLDLHLRIREYPDYAKKHLHDVATRLSAVILTDGIQLRNVVPAEGIVADYTAQSGDGHKRQVDTLKEKPSKQTIAAGKFFAETALAYVQSDEFMTSPARRIANRLLGYDDSEFNGMSHSFFFEMNPNLPLNGYESRSFLLHFEDYMAGRLQNVEARIQRLEGLSAPVVLSEPAKERVASYSAALARVRAILEDKRGLAD